MKTRVCLMMVMIRIFFYSGFNSRTFQGLPKASPVVFKDCKSMKNTDLHVKFLHTCKIR